MDQSNSYNPTGMTDPSFWPSSELIDQKSLIHQLYDSFVYDCGLYFLNIRNAQIPNQIFIPLYLITMISSSTVIHWVVFRKWIIFETSVMFIISIELSIRFPAVAYQMLCPLITTNWLSLAVNNLCNLLGKYVI